VAAIILALPTATIVGQRANVPLAALLTLEKPSVTIGAAARGPAAFGTIGGVAMDSAGNVYVLDRADNSVRSFARSGTYLGRSTNRAGELRDPLGLWHDHKNSLFVVDRYLGIARFTTAGGVPVHANQLTLDFRPTNVCGVGDDLVVAGMRDGRVLSIVSRDGAVKRSFGERFRTDSVAGIQQNYDTDEFKITCDERTDRVFVAEGSQPLVRAYDRTGSLLWQAQLPEYDGNVVRRNTNPPGIAVFYGKLATKAATLVDSTLLIVQATQRPKEREPARGGARSPEEDGIVTYALDVSTGAVLTRQFARQLLSTGYGGRVVGYDRDRAYVFRAHAVASGR
jgi:hypothetical protein